MTKGNTMKDEILDLPMDENDAGAETIREYLRNLLTEVIVKGEGFSGKRPFGNSGWEYELFTALAKNNKIDHKKTEYDDGYVEYYDYDEHRGYTLLLCAIERM